MRRIVLLQLRIGIAVAKKIQPNKPEKSGAQRAPLFSSRNVKTGSAIQIA
jgi:hypothetical protein